MDPAAALVGLDDVQRRAVTSAASPLAVIAPAGSGKTRVLTSRVAHRVATGEIEPAHVLCVTFTRKAASELRSRLGRLGIRDRIEAGTFHGIAWRQLRDRWAAQGRSAPTLLDRVRPFLRQELGITSTPEVAELAAEISWARARSVRPSGYPAAAAAAGRRTRAASELVAERFAAYEQAKARRHVLDFDDLLAACTAAIHGDPQFAAAQRWRFRHLFVDEFQDVNALQFELLEAWRGDRWDVFVVGDTHQSIYGWNGAEPALLTTLHDRWPALETIELDRTHRSTPQITAAGAAVVAAAGLPDRHPQSSGAPGPAARIVAHADERSEVAELAALLRRNHGLDRPWRDMAILARTHAQLVELERGLTLLGIPTRIRRQSGLLDDPVVRDALHRMSGDERPLLTSLADARGDRRDMALDELAEAAEEQRREDDAMTGATFVAWARANLVERDTAHDAVTLSTIHAAKGLEWPEVHVVGCEEGSIPLSTARRRAERDEEARLLYVAITRAMHRVTLHWTRSRLIRGSVRARERSSFLRDFEARVEALAPSTPTDGHDVLVDLRRVVATGRRDPDPVRAALLAWRTGRARAARTEPEVLLPDEAIDAIVRARPTSVEDLSSLAGIGPARRRRYGRELLDVVERVTSVPGAT